VAKNKAEPLRLIDDPRYFDFVQRYAFEPWRFAAEVVGVVPTAQQMELYQSVARPGSRTSISSGHGTGKTGGFSIIALWHLVCYVNSNTIITAPRIATVHDGVWKEFADQLEKIRRGPQAWIADYIDLQHERVSIFGYKLSWWIVSKSAPRGSPENLAGAHRDWLLWLVDEASGVPDQNFGVIGGSLTDARNRMCIASQPTRPNGFFRDTHNSLSKSRGGTWSSLTFNSEESPLVSDDFIREKIHQYGGRDDPLYQIKVRGMFPENLAGQLLSRSVLEEAIGAPCCIPAGSDWGWAVLVDIGAGEYRDKSVIAVVQVWGHGQSHEMNARHVHVVSVPLCDNTTSPTALVGEIMNVAGKLSNAVIVLDGGGLGLGVVKRLQELGVPNIVKALWGNPCFKKSLKESYFNQRAHAMVSIARAVKAKQFSIAADAIGDSRVVTEMLDQGSRIPYHFNDRAQYVIESKRSKEWEGLPSPDIWDALSFAFLEDCSYVMSEADAGDSVRSTVRETAISKLEAALEAAMGAVAV
jgi:hypothetical protein